MSLTFLPVPKSFAFRWKMTGVSKPIGDGYGYGYGYGYGDGYGDGDGTLPTAANLPLVAA